MTGQDGQQREATHTHGGTDAPECRTCRYTVVPCSQCPRPRSTDPESEEGMSGMCLRCLHGGRPVADPGTLSDPELSEGERAAYLGSPAPRDRLAGSDEAVEALARQLLADYDSKFKTRHLSWQDFAGQARRLLVAVEPVRAEAVAEERQRIKALIWAERSASDGDLIGKTWNSAIGAAATLAAGSVRVTTGPVVVSGGLDAAEAYWDAVAAFTTERNHGPLSTTLGWSIRHGEIGAALRAAGSVTVAAPRRPEIVVLCGSTRFKDAFREAGRTEALAGRIVLTVSDLDPRPEMRHVNVPIDAETKARLDELHKRKIDLADSVLVLNVGGYIGESTRSEIDYATAHGKPITYLEDGPVATPAEPAGETLPEALGLTAAQETERRTQLRAELDAIDRAERGQPAAPVDLLAVLDEGNCEHGNDPVLCGKCDDPETAAGPSVGTGTPAERERAAYDPQRLAVLTAEVMSDGASAEAVAGGEVRAWRAFYESEAQRDRLTAEAARLRRERNQALQRELETVCRCVELTADVARYSATVRAVRQVAAALKPENPDGPAQLGFENGVDCLLITLAAALRDGE